MKQQYASVLAQVNGASFSTDSWSTVQFEFPAMPCPMAMQKEKPLTKSELDHVTKLFDGLFSQVECPLPSDIALELDCFECEFSSKYLLPSIGWMIVEPAMMIA